MILRQLRRLLLPALLLAATSVHALVPEPGDDFLEGYVAAVLERELGWAPGSFQVEVRNSIATVVVNVDDPVERERAERALARIAGLEQIHVIVSSAAPRADNDPIVFPAGDLFRPLVADPKQPQFFVSFVRMTTPADSFTGASVGYGENFGLWRWPGAHPGDGWQLNFAGGLFALFNLSAPSSDLINADYNIGFSLTHGDGPLSTRFRLFHQSSHLGDEFLLSQPNIQRINLSIEVVDAVASYEWERWRVYGGAGYLIGRDPGEIKPGLAEVGIEYRGQRLRSDLGRLIGGIDLRSIEEQNWKTAKSVKIGLELGQADPGRRRVRVLAEYYDGFSPFGQFFRTDIHYYGVGVYFGF
jgi:hypothetical protein